MASKMASKSKSVWYCTSCGNESPKWMGRCPACGEWNTMVEAPSEAKKQAGGSARPGADGRKPRRLSDVDFSAEARKALGIAELDRLLGGGIVGGSLILIGGEPGIGKSTLSLQIPLGCPSLRTLYVTGEESEKQVKMRALRLAPEGIPDDCLIFCETQAAMLLRFAKDSGVPVILIGHITKDGYIAGPKVLEHIVDVVLQFEGDNKGSYRILRSIKNRFGSTSELAVFEMTGSGLREVPNPSEMLIPMHEEGLSGTAITAMLDGTRPLLFEVQALVSSAAYGTAQRSATGFDTRRLNMLLAVLEKRAGFHLSAKDVFLNMAGGLKVSDPACDLAVICAVLSSNFDYPLSLDCCFAGEVGLSGEIRPVAQTDRRISEAARLGFKKIFISSYSSIDGKTPAGIRVVKVADVPELVKALFK